MEFISKTPDFTSDPDFTSNPEFTSNPWKPRFKVGDCIMYGKNVFSEKYQKDKPDTTNSRNVNETFCIKSIENENGIKLYHFEIGTFGFGPPVDLGFYNFKKQTYIEPAILVSRPAPIGGKKKSRRRLKKKKTKRRKTNRRR